jgi:hydrogenase maturation protease
LSQALRDAAAQQQVVLIGIGSPFSDDTLGWQLLDALEQLRPEWPGFALAFEKADRPGPSLLERMQGHDVAVLLDALDADLPPGTLQLLQQDELAGIAKPTSSHSLGVAEALALGETLQMLPEKVYLLGIQMGAGLSAQTVEEAAARLEALFAAPRR